MNNDATSLITQLKETGQPIVLTINGKAELLVQDEGSYEKLLELAERIETVEALKFGINEMEAGKGELAEKVFTPRILASGLPVKDRSLEYDWLREHRDEYAGLYVALNEDILISQGKTFKEVATAARELGVTDALIMFVESSDTPPYVGF